MSAHHYCIFSFILYFCIVIVMSLTLSAIDCAVAKIWFHWHRCLC